MATDTEVSAVSAQIPTNVAGKNVVINGGMDIWQRGLSINGSTNGTYTSDRWSTGRSGSPLTITRQATGDTANLPNIQYCARVQRDSGNTSTGPGYIIQPIESSNSIPFAGKTVTLSFYARKGADYSTTNSWLNPSLWSGTGIDQNPWSGYTNTANIINSNVILTTTWQRYEITATVGSTATELLVQFGFSPIGTAGTNDYFEITGVQLEVGSLATPFSRAGGDIQGELAKCQRYYFRDVYGYLGGGIASSTTVARMNVPLPVTMRVTPHTVDFSGLGIQDGVNYWVNGTITLAGNGSRTSGNVLYTHPVAAMTQFRFYVFGWNDGNTYLGFSAEL
jgi:hypothetical protein